MARLAIQNPQSATGSNKEIFDFLQKNLGVVPNMTKVMGNSPAVLQAFAQFNGAMGGAKLDAKVREAIALLTAERNTCTYCLSAHSVLGKLAGLTPEQIGEARNGAAGDTKTAGALAFARALLDARGAVTDADVASARRAGLDDAELAEVVGAVALNVFTNYFNRAFAVDVDFPRVEARESGAVR